MSKYKKPLFIAELCCNHQGSIDIAKLMINLAVEAGVDIVKFQKRDIDMSHIFTSYQKTPLFGHQFFYSLANIHMDIFGKIFNLRFKNISGKSKTGNKNNRVAFAFFNVMDFNIGINCLIFALKIIFCHGLNLLFFCVYVYDISYFLK